MTCSRPTINLFTQARTKKKRDTNLRVDDSKQFLIDMNDRVWDWRDPKGNWTNRAIFDTAYAKFILTACEEYWRPSYSKFNHLIYQDFVSKMQTAEKHEPYYEKVKVSLKKALLSFEYSSIFDTSANYSLYLQLKQDMEISWQLLDSILKELLLPHDFKICVVNQFYYELTLAPYGSEPIKSIIPLPPHEELIVSDEKWANLYETAQPNQLFGPKANPAQRGRIKNNDEDMLDRFGRTGYKKYDGYTLVDAPYRKYAHFSATSFFKLMTESESEYIKEMHERGFNVNAGPSGTMGRIQLLLKIFRDYHLISVDEAKWITIAAAADFVIRGQHTFAEALQACQTKPLEDKTSCFGLFELPNHLLIRDPRTWYEEFLPEDFKYRMIYQSFKKDCDDLIRPLDKSRFSHVPLPAI